MKNSISIRILLILTILGTSFSAFSQDTKSAVLFANHTDLEFTTSVRVTGNQDMVEIGKSDILPWEGTNHHDLGDRIVTTILDIVFNIDVSHNDNGHLVKCERFAFLGNDSYHVEIDIVHQGELVFTIDYNFLDIFFNFQNPTNYNVKYPDGSYDVENAYSLLNEQHNQPHPANRILSIDGKSYKLIYGTFDNSSDATNNLIYSLSELEPITLNYEPKPQEIEDPTILNVLTYNIGLLMPLGSNDQEERERVPVIHQAIPKNMDIIMWQEMFEQYWVNRIIDSLSEYYPYHTSPHNQAEIPGLTKNGGALIMSKHPILEEDDFSYLRDGGIEAAGESVLADKGVKYAKINKNGQIIHVFNTHTSGQAIENDAMGKWISEKLQQNYDDIVIMGGDMNTRIFETQYYRMVDSLHALTPNYLSLLNDPKQTKGTTWGFNHYGGGRNDSGNFIDYIFASSRFKLPIVCYNETQTYRLNILDKNFWGVFDLGDHQPVYARMLFPSIAGQISDTAVCVGDDFQISIQTTLEDYTINWYKDDVLLPNETTLTLSRQNIEESDWGNYRCELLYSYEADQAINGAPTHYGAYVHPGANEGKLVRSFNVDRDNLVCGLTTDIPFSSNLMYKIYPNPMGEYITLESKDEILLKVSDTKGALILEKTISQSTTIEVSDWEKGIYIFECFKDGQLIGLESVVKQ